MTDKQRQHLAWAIVAIVLTIVAIFLGVTYPIPEPPDAWIELGTTHFTAIEAEDLTATDDLTVTDDATIGGDLVVTGSATAGAVIDVGTFLNLSAATTISVTADGIITPTGTYQPLTSAAFITTSTSCAVFTGTRTGDLLILKNANTDTDYIITIDGTGGNVECKADKQLVAGDTLTLIWDGIDWICIAEHDNS